MIWYNDQKVINILILIAELIKVHDETLEQTKNWFEGSSDFVKKGIVDHYGNLPETEADFWTMPNGPTWLWWVLNTLPIDPPLKVIFNSTFTSSLLFIEKSRPKEIIIEKFLQTKLFNL